MTDKRMPDVLEQPRRRYTCAFPVWSAQMFILPGSSALSAPRYQALQGALGEVDPGLAVQDVFFVYAVDHSGPCLLYTSDAADE